jgi:hypothetical protein
MKIAASGGASNSTHDRLPSGLLIGFYRKKSRNAVAARWQIRSPFGARRSGGFIC